MSEISKAYEPQLVEDKWYQSWLDGKFFVANEHSTKPAYSIVIPPPNVTGVLHMGHVLNNTIQDILARKARMDGKEVLWLPGTDHAGIATQVQVEKLIRKEEKKTKHDLGRDEFLKRVWTWKEKHGGIIIAQLKKLGCSCDWTRERFTMDPDYSRNVQLVFVDLFKKKLIYRGKRMVNWCPATQTALSDEEVIMKEQKGLLYYFKVQVAESDAKTGRPLTPALLASQARHESVSPQETFATRTVVPDGGEGDGAAHAKEGSPFGPMTDAEGRVWLTIATTRPETIPGDTAVAVNPKDPRYAKFIGKHVLRPLPVEFSREQKLIPIIGDEHVDFEFGTGVLKVTPAHDKADFDIGQRHKLAVIEVINADGSMGELAGADLRGLDRFKARKVAVEKLTELGSLDKEEPYTNKVGYSERADVPIEPRLSEQWFLKYPSVEKSRSVVANGTMKFHPERWAKVYDHWMGGLQDWCISRQLWWGHRIPVWSKQMFFSALPEAVKQALREAGSSIVTTTLPNSTASIVWDIVSEDGDDIFVRALTESPEAGAYLTKLGFTQDPDVLDTWFSSWLWPFATMGWPEKTDTLKKFYPTVDLVTAPEIIFFWVARMIMAGYEYMHELPFHNVYFTGIIRDKQGRKMSKTLGNSPDPLDLFAKYGADAVRFGTMRSAPLGQDVMFDEKDVELGRNFCNKLWNASRFRQMQGGEVQEEINPQLLTSDDKWILLKLDTAIREVTTSLAEYKFNEAAQTLYRFFWSEYCDWYVEASKATLSSRSRGDETLTSPEESQRLLTSSPTQIDEPRRANTIAVIDFVLSHTLRMFHPFLPFITEELWHGMGYSADMPENQGGKTIMFAPWPKPLGDDIKAHYGLDAAAETVATAKYEMVSLGRNLRRELKLDPAKKLNFVLQPAGTLPANEVEVLKLLLNAESVDIVANYTPPKGTPSASNPLGELFLPTTGLIDFAAEHARRTKELETIRAEIGKVEAKLANPAFAEKVPAKVLEEHRQRLADWQAKEKQTLEALKNLPG